jgi:hypothetical protein
MFYSEYMDSCCARDPEFQFEAGKIFNLDRMVVYDENDEDKEMKDQNHWPLKRERTSDLYVIHDTKAFSDVLKTYKSIFPNGEIRKSSDIMPIIKSIVQAKFDQDSTTENKKLRQNWFAKITPIML